MRVVLRLGGSVLAPDDIDHGFMSDFVEQILKVKNKNEIALEVGSGGLSRKYIEAARRFHASNVSCDNIGMEVSRLNALLLIGCIKESYPRVIREFPEASIALSMNKIPVLGGTHPGHTNDAVAAMLAEYLKAELLVKITNVSGIYTKDPNRHKDAELLKKMSFSDLKGFVLEEFFAGRSSIIDPLAAKIIAGARIKTFVVGKKDAANLSGVLKGRHSGTTIEG